VLNALQGSKSAEIKFNLSLSRGFCAAKRNAARRDACAPGKKFDFYGVESRFQLLIRIRIISVLHLLNFKKKKAVNLPLLSFTDFL